MGKCPICDFEIKNNLSICPGCSSKLKKCGSCGVLVFHSAVVCPECGEDPNKVIEKQSTYTEKKQEGLQKLYAEGVRIKTGMPSVNTIQNNNDQTYIPVTAEKSFTGKAVITLILYYVGFWVVGFIANLIFRNESNREATRIGRPPDGAGCLGILWFFHVTLPIILIFVLLIISAITGFSIWSLFS